MSADRERRSRSVRMCPAATRLRLRRRVFDDHGARRRVSADQSRESELLRVRAVRLHLRHDVHDRRGTRRVPADRQLVDRLRVCAHRLPVRVELFDDGWRARHLQRQSNR